MKRYTLKDIAKLGGVSPKTVSRVVNNEEYVKKETKEKILELLEKYDYHPNIPARSLVLKRSNTLGLIVPSLENPFYSRLARGVIQTAEKNGYRVIVCESKFSLGIGEKYLKILIGGGVDGLLIATLDLNDIVVKKLNNIGEHFVIMTCKLDIPGINYVIANDYEAGRKVAEYIINLGHKNIAFLKGPDVYSSNERLTAYNDVMNEKNLEIKDYFITKNVLDRKSAYKVTLKLLKENNDITAIIGNNDYTAIGAIKAIEELGLNIPKDISIIGYDDIDITELLKVPLTTVHYPKFKCGVEATKSIIRMLEKKGSRSKKIVLETSFVERDSCGPVRTRDISISNN